MRKIRKSADTEENSTCKLKARERIALATKIRRRSETCKESEGLWVRNIGSQARRSIDTEVREVQARMPGDVGSRERKSNSWHGIQHDDSTKKQERKRKECAKPFDKKWREVTVKTVEWKG